MGASGKMMAGAALAVAMAWGQAAQASVLSFTYRYADGQNFGATVEGSYAADGNIFNVTKVDQVYGNGTSAFPDPGQIVLTSGYNVLSLNGVGVKFQVTSSAGGVVLDIENTASSTYATPGNQVFTFGSTLPNEGFQVFIPSGYSTSNLPEPATMGLFCAGLLGLGLTRRLRQG